MANTVYKTGQSRCKLAAWQPATTVLVVPTMTLSADCPISYTHR